MKLVMMNEENLPAQCNPIIKAKKKKSKENEK